ncbi:phasin family protein [Amphibacillus sp. Q70]|uniref:phasin family protein n=1 Tax=Amphibacillus sp. Q70 TaxID=3453416 RepID=UPI003F84AC83
MKETFKKGVALGLGLAATGVEQAEKVIDELVKKGEMTREESKAFFNEYYKKGKDKQKEMLTDLNFATQDDIKRLEARIDALAEQINRDK